MVQRWRDTFCEVTSSNPLFVKIYGTLIVSVLVSSLYIFTAIDSSAYGSSSSSPPLSNLTPILVSPPLDKKMPPLETFKLTKEMVGKRAIDNVIIVTFGNYAFMDFILNWVKHLTHLNLSNFLVGAMDIKLLEALYWEGVPVFDMGSNMSMVDVGWGSPAFHKMGREKVILIDTILPYGYELLMCDTDMVWLKNPLPYFARYPDADLLTSCDEVIPTVVDDSLEIWQQVTLPYNIGIFHWRPTKSAKKLAKEWKQILLADDKIWDQDGFNSLVERQLGPSVDQDNGLFYAYDGNLKLGILPVSIFCGGHTYFVQAMHQQLKLEPYAIHTTFQYSGTEGKRHRLREAMVFYDPPDYYDEPGGFLSFKPSISKSMLLDGNHTIESHFSLVNHQIKQIRSALAVASLLNRTLVMPLIWCRLDRLYGGHSGTIVGSLTHQPFVCPLDHVFELNMMVNKELQEEADFGPAIGIREYSFLENPLLPINVKESYLDIQICQRGSLGCEASNQTNSHGILKFPNQSNEEMFEAVFSSFKDVKIIKFSSIEDAFIGFSNKEREERFRRRVKRYVGRWCCEENKYPGHIYYDMYWDEKLNWKPIPPTSIEEDHPPY